MKKIVLSLILISIIVILLCKRCCIKVTKYIYYEPKLYPILDENFRPSVAPHVKNPQVKLLNDTDKGIILELIDTTGYTEPFKDSFYCILTDDKVLKYYNGYIRYTVNGVNKGEAIDKLGLSDHIKNNDDGSISVDWRLIEFEVLNKEYAVKLTDYQYMKIISYLNKLNNDFLPTNNKKFEKVTDYNMYKGLCLKSGYFDGRTESGLLGYDYAEKPFYCNLANNDKFSSFEEAEQKYIDLFGEIYNSIQSCIPNLEPFSFEKSFGNN